MIKRLTKKQKALKSIQDNFEKHIKLIISVFYVFSNEILKIMKMDSKIVSI